MKNILKEVQIASVCLMVYSGFSLSAVGLVASALFFSVAKVVEVMR